MVAMRRKDRQVSDEEAMAYLKAAEYGVLSTVGPDGEPYGVPLTYAVEEDGKGLSSTARATATSWPVLPRIHGRILWRCRKRMCCPKNFPLSTRASWSPGFLRKLRTARESPLCAGCGRQIFHHQLGRVRQPRRRQDPGVPPEYRAYFRQAFVKAGEPGMGYKKGSKDTANEEEAGLFLVLLPGRFGAGCLPLLLGKRASHTQDSVRWLDERAFFQER